jgi:hypothetical protein
MPAHSGKENRAISKGPDAESAHFGENHLCRNYFGSRSAVREKSGPPSQSTVCDRHHRASAAQERIFRATRCRRPLISCNAADRGEISGSAVMMRATSLASITNRWRRSAQNRGPLLMTTDYFAAAWNIALPELVF